MSAKQTDKFSPTRWCAAESSVRSASPANITSLPATRSTSRRSPSDCFVYRFFQNCRNILSASSLLTSVAVRGETIITLPNKVLRFRGTPYAIFQGRI